MSGLQRPALSLSPGLDPQWPIDSTGGIRAQRSDRHEAGGAERGPAGERVRKAPQAGGSGLRCVVKNDAEREAPAGADAADAVAHRHPVGAARSFDRAMMDREDHRLPLPQRHNFAA
jgi:hypothetical protein